MSMKSRKENRIEKGAEKCGFEKTSRTLLTIESSVATRYTCKRCSKEMVKDGSVTGYLRDLADHYYHHRMVDAGIVKQEK